jgi:hypothetical protein
MYETLVHFYRSTQLCKPEDSRLHTHRREFLKSYKIFLVFLLLVLYRPVEFVYVSKSLIKFVCFINSYCQCRFVLFSNVVYHRGKDEVIYGKFYWWLRCNEMKVSSRNCYLFLKLHSFGKGDFGLITSLKYFSLYRSNQFVLSHLVFAASSVYCPFVLADKLFLSFWDYNFHLYNFLVCRYIVNLKYSLTYVVSLAVPFLVWFE